MLILREVNLFIMFSVYSNNYMRKELEVFFFASWSSLSSSKPWDNLLLPYYLSPDFEVKSYISSVFAASVNLGIILLFTFSILLLKRKLYFQSTGDIIKKLIKDKKQWKKEQACENQKKMGFFKLSFERWVKLINL